MTVSTPDIAEHWMELSNFLQELRKELDLHSSKVTADYGLEDLENYILDLNSFYYENFNNRFFPLYKRIIAEETSRLYHISRQEATLKTDILSNLQQYARLYNQIKSAVARLKAREQEIKRSELLSGKGNSQYNAELLYFLKDLVNRWDSFRALMDRLQKPLEDQQLLRALKQYPAHAVLGPLINSWEADGSKEVRDLNRLLAGWHMAVDLLSKLSDKQLSVREIESILNELEKIDEAWAGKKSPPPVRSWYKQHVQNLFRLYLGSISPEEAKNERGRSLQAAGQFQDWLKSLLYVLEQSLKYKSRGERDLLNHLYFLTGADGKCLKELVNYSLRSLKTLEDLINSLASSPQAEYALHSQSIRKTLAEPFQFFKLQLDSNINSLGIIVAAEMESLKNQIDLLQSQIQILDEKAEYESGAVQHYRVIIGMLASSLDLLIAIKEELEKKLDPRIIKRNYPDMDLEIKQIPIFSGALFPADYSYMLDKLSIETTAEDVNDGRILYEEGDIFIIRLNELQTELIPRIVIAKKG